MANTVQLRIFYFEMGFYAENPFDIKVNGEKQKRAIHEAKVIHFKNQTIYFKNSCDTFC